ncbi:interferon alpha-inducible protein 27-like protein 2 isoform X2 [Equus quagga]|uniref:interferon alpha-inducible protein 27-like protein 2 isoform X2 n=1 Tax=Equus quagga TaxID=89248 RepID=UPI001EE1AF16|nr:interferon alpha-inducible protein 27-like protein 2 isoform X2 [Equus quagga]
MIKRAAAAAIGGALAVGAVPVVLGAMGFTGAGIAASSIAAKMMSAAAIANGGGVAPGSLVAVLQSVVPSILCPKWSPQGCQYLEEGSRGSWTLHVIQHPPGLCWVNFWGLAGRFKKGTPSLCPRCPQG